MGGHIVVQTYGEPDRAAYEAKIQSMLYSLAEERPESAGRPAVMYVLSLDVSGPDVYDVLYNARHNGSAVIRVGVADEDGMFDTAEPYTEAMLGGFGIQVHEEDAADRSTETLYEAMLAAQEPENDLRIAAGVSTLDDTVRSADYSPRHLAALVEDGGRDMVYRARLQELIQTSFDSFAESASFDAYPRS